jgi:nucleoside-diphosphate-sugar epimerase
MKAWNHSFDVVRAIEECARKPHHGEVYHLGGGRTNSISIREAMTRIEVHMGTRSRGGMSSKRAKATTSATFPIVERSGSTILIGRFQSASMRF